MQHESKHRKNNYTFSKNIIGTALEDEICYTRAAKVEA